MHLGIYTKLFLINFNNFFKKINGISILKKAEFSRLLENIFTKMSLTAKNIREDVINKLIKWWFYYALSTLWRKYHRRSMPAMRKNPALNDFSGKSYKNYKGEKEESGKRRRLPLLRTHQKDLER
jgi:hypothetical protein